MQEQVKRLYSLAINMMLPKEREVRSETWLLILLVFKRTLILMCDDISTVVHALHSRAATVLLRQTRVVSIFAVAFARVYLGSGGDFCEAI